MTGGIKLQYLSADLPVLGKLCTVFTAVLLRSTSAESFQLLAVYFQLAVFPQDFQLHLQVLNLSFHGVQLGEKSSAVSVFRYCRLPYLIRRGTVLGYHILCDTGELHIATVDSVLNELVRWLLCDNSDLCPRRVDHNSVILSDAVFDLPCFIVPAECSGTSHLGSRIAFFLLRKHKFQVDLVVWIVLNKHTILGALPDKIIEVLACFHNLIYRVFQLGFPR